jgi:hypothetical protein
MNATVGDQLLILSNELQRPIRDGEIVEVHGKDGAPPYLVRWSDTGRTTLVFPGSDARVHSTHASSAAISSR